MSGHWLFDESSELRYLSPSMPCSCDSTPAVIILFFKNHFDLIKMGK